MRPRATITWRLSCASKNLTLMDPQKVKAKPLLGIELAAMKPNFRKFQSARNIIGALIQPGP
jgi:hypothetical protein